MYIGPWQEFNLNKARNSNSESEKNKIIHQNLVSILENSLDPVAAQQAIQAIKPYLNDVAEATSKSKPPRQASSVSRFPRVLPKDRRVKSYRHIKRSGEVSRHDSSHSALPLVLSARNSYEVDGPPSDRSIMSTSSEPTHRRISSFTPEKKIPPVRLAKLQTEKKQQPLDGYDPANVLDILRIERNAESSRAKNKHADLSSFWKWKSQGKPLPSTFTESVSGGSTDKKMKLGGKNDAQAESSKEERVNKLRKIYSQREGAAAAEHNEVGTLASTSSQHQHQHLPLSPIHSVRPRPSYSKPGTPVVRDQDLTEVDLAAVSKYFQRNQQDLGTLTQQRARVGSNCSSSSSVLSPLPSHRGAMITPSSPGAGARRLKGPVGGRETSPQRTRLRAHSPDRLLHLPVGSSSGELRPQLQQHHHRQQQQQQQQQQQEVRLDTSKSLSQHADEGSMAAEEGLLAWCSALALDDIDNMY